MKDAPSESEFLAIGTVAGFRGCCRMTVNPLTIEECHAKAEECRDLAKRAARPQHRIMLEHMAETWDRICAELKTDGQ